MADSSTQVGFINPKRIRLIARILSVAIIAFALVMLLGHMFFPEPTVEDYPPIENLQPVIMGVSVLCLAIAWRWEAWGGALSLIFFVLNLGLYWIIRGHFFPIAILINFSPLPLTAILFLYLGRLKKFGSSML